MHGRWPLGAGCGSSYGRGWKVASGRGFVDLVRVSEGPFRTITSDGADRSDPGCYELAVDDARFSTYELVLFFGGGAGGAIGIEGITTVWAPASQLGSPRQDLVEPPLDDALAQRLFSD